MYGKYIDSKEEAKINCLRLKLFFQSTSHLEKDKLASISYNYDVHSISYKAYLSAKATIAENTMPSTLNFKPAYISVTFNNQKMIPPTSYYQSSNCKSDIGKIFISSWYAKQNNLLPSINHLNQPTLRLKDGTKIGYRLCD
ncbi:hypothetical protein C1646_775021 [Rhizophagus diaphanus]|nr:hypothetical protein C1646_775021 [Rhizophagus diaphanus] [Rhizophagus sp. MUCL 43196]